MSKSVLLSAFLLLSSVSAFADDPPASGQHSNQSINFAQSMPPDVYKDYREACFGKVGDATDDSKKNASTCADLKAQFSSVQKNDAVTCAAKVKDFNKHANDFKSACLAGGISDPDSSSGGFACARNLQACGQCQGKGKKSSDDDDDDSSGSDKGVDCSQYDKGSGGSSSNASTSKFAFCPDLAAKDLKQWEKDVETAQKAVDDLRSKIPEEQAKLAKVDSDVAAKKEEMASKSAEADSKFRDRRQQIEDGAEESVKAAIATKRGMQDKYDAYSDEISNQKRTIEEAYLKTYKGTIRQLQLTCHADALKQVEAMREARLAQIKTSSFTAGGFNALVRQMGLTDLQRDQIMASRFYNLCVQDKAYALQAKAAADDYHAQYKRSADRIDQQKREQLKNIDDQNKVLTSDIPSAQGKALRALDAAKKDRDAIKTTLASAEARLDNDALTQKNTIQQKLMELNTQLQQKTNFLNDKMAVLKAKQAGSGGSEMSSSDITKLWSSNSEAGAAARTLVDGTEGDNAAGQKCCDNPTYTGACKNAHAFLGAGGDDGDDGTPAAKVQATVETPAVTPNNQSFGAGTSPFRSFGQSIPTGNPFQPTTDTPAGN